MPKSPSKSAVRNRVRLRGSEWGIRLPVNPVTKRVAAKTCRRIFMLRLRIRYSGLTVNGVFRLTMIPPRPSMKPMLRIKVRRFTSRVSRVMKLARRIMKVILSRIILFVNRLRCL